MYRRDGQKFAARGTLVFLMLKSDGFVSCFSLHYDILWTVERSS